jgi:glycolate oxidase
MRVHRLPPYHANGGFLFDFFDDAVKAQLELAAMELGPLSTCLTSKSFARDHKALARVDPGGKSHGWLILELEGERPEVERAKRTVSDVAEARGGHKISQRSMDSIGGLLSLFTEGARRSAMPASAVGAKVRVSRHVWVPPNRILEVYHAFEALVEKSGLSDPTAVNTPTRIILGCLIDPNSKRESLALARLFEELQRVTQGYGGTIFGAHGIGLVNVSAVEREYGEGPIELMRKIKLAMDPEQIMNPSKAIDLFRGESGRRRVSTRRKRRHPSRSQGS